MNIRFSKVRVTDHRPPGAGAKLALEHGSATRGGACLNCKWCGQAFFRSLKSTRISCSDECAAQLRVSGQVKQEYWWLTSKGYLEGNVWVDGVRKRKRQHRWVMEKHLGRDLKPWEHVHHKDGNRTNNDLSNLEILEHVEHALLHNEVLRKKNGWNPKPHQVRRVKTRAEARKKKREGLV